MGIITETFEGVRDFYFVDGIDRSMYINNQASKQAFERPVYDLCDDDFPVLQDLLYLKSKNVKPEMGSAARKFVMVHIELTEKARIENNPRIKKGLKQIKTVSTCPFIEMNDDMIAEALDGKYGTETKYFIKKRDRLIRIENTLKELPVQEYKELSAGDLLNVIIDARRGYAFADIPYELIPKAQDGKDGVTVMIERFLDNGNVTECKNYMRSIIYRMQKDQDFKYYSFVNVKKSALSRPALLYFIFNAANVRPGFTTTKKDGMKEQRYGWIQLTSKKRISCFFTEFLAYAWDMSFLT